MNELTEKRTPELIGAEIRMYVDTGRRISLLCGIEIGRRLVEAKEMLEHGQWLPWLERETEFSNSSAQRYMKLFDEYGASQQGLFGPETNSPTLGNLPISKALALLSVPENDRIEFAEQVDAEHISVRELEEKIREREQQLEDEKKQREQTEDLLKTQDQMLADAKAQIAELAKHNKELENRPHEVAVETVRDEAAIAEAAKEAREKAEAEAKKAADAAKKQIADLEKRLNKAEDDAAKAKKEAQSAGEGATEKADAAKKEAESLRAQLEEARKQLKTSEADVTAFSIYFQAVQADFENMMAELERVERRDQGKSEKLRDAVRELIKQIREQVERNV